MQLVAVAILRVFEWGCRLNLVSHKQNSREDSSRLCISLRKIVV